MSMMMEVRVKKRLHLIKCVNMTTQDGDRVCGGENEARKEKELEKKGRRVEKKEKTN